MRGERHVGWVVVPASRGFYARKSHDNRVRVSPVSLDDDGLISRSRKKLTTVFLEYRQEASEVFLIFLRIVDSNLRHHVRTHYYLLSLSGCDARVSRSPEDGFAASNPALLRLMELSWSRIGTDAGDRFRVP